MTQWALYACKRAKDDGRSVDIEDRTYVFTLLVVLNDDLWLHKRLRTFLIKLLCVFTWRHGGHICVPQNNETAAMFVSQTSPVGVEL